MTSQPSKRALAAAPILAVVYMSMPTTGQAQPMAATATSECLAPPAIPVPPLHGDGSAITLHWPAHPESKGHTLWAQWRVPEGPVVTTLERQLDSETLSTTMPPSPQPWRHLMLLVEVARQCQGEPGTPLRSSAPAEVRQLQFSAQHACAPVEGLAKATLDVPAPANAPPARTGLRWHGQPQETFEITWFDPSGRRVLTQVEVQGATISWPAVVQGSSLIRARRSCGEGRWSTPVYRRAP